jgi:hypothetical protein
MTVTTETFIDENGHYCLCFRRGEEFIRFRLVWYQVPLLWVSILWTRLAGGKIRVWCVECEKSPGASS